MCAVYDECRYYDPAVAAKKPVFNIEYDPSAFKKACANRTASGLTPLFKVRFFSIERGRVCFFGGGAAGGLLAFVRAFLCDVFAVCLLCGVQRVFLFCCS